MVDGVEVVEQTVTTLPEPEVELREPVPAGLEEHPPAGPDPIAALDAQDWWWTKDYGEAIGVVLDYRRARYENPFRLPEVRSRYVNVRDGRRATWRPPCDEACDLPVVWVYGGSTAFGLDQRDDHTIASELARVAHADGIDIEVHNRGIPWFAHWQEAERLAWDLTAEGPPDLVLFYDGYNDLSMIDPDENHWNGKDSPIDTGGIVAWDTSGRSAGERPNAPEGATRHLTTRPAPTEHEQATRTLDRYDKARSISRAASAAAGVPVRYLWQPTRYDRPLVEGEMHWATDVENGWRKVVQIIGDNLPGDVLNLQDVLDEHLEPVYTDDVHHNEKGARIIARAIYDRIRPDLVEISNRSS